MCAVTIFSQTAVPLYSLSLSLSQDVKTASARNPQTSRLPQPRANSPKAKPNKDMADVARRAQDPVLVMDANELARRLHQSSGYFLLDCRPVLAFNSSHISGAVNINFTNMMKKRFLSGKIGLADLVTSEEGKEKFKVWPCSGNLSSPSPSLHICVPPSLSFSLLLFLLPPSLPPSLSPSPSSPALFLLPSFFSSIRIRVSLSHASILPSFLIYPTPLSPPFLPHSLPPSQTVIEMREGDLLTVVYDDATSDLHSLSCSSAMLLVIRALEKMGKCPYLLLGRPATALLGC